MPINHFLVGSLTTIAIANGSVLPFDQDCSTASTPFHWANAISDDSHARGPAQPSRVRCPVRLSDWSHEFAANAESLVELRPGWDGPGSVAISASALSRAMFYVKTAIGEQRDVTAPRLVPGGDGSVQIEWHSRHGELEFGIDDRGEMSIWIRNHLSGAEFDGDGAEALALFYRWSPWIATRQRDASDVPASTQVATYAFAA